MIGLFIPMLGENTLELGLGEEKTNVKTCSGWVPFSDLEIKEDDVVTLYYQDKEILYVHPSSLQKTYDETPQPKVTTCRNSSIDEKGSLYPIHKTNVFPPDGIFCIHLGFLELKNNYPLNISLLNSKEKLIYSRLEIIPPSQISAGTKTACHQINLSHYNFSGDNYFWVKIELLNGELVFEEKIFLKQKETNIYPHSGWNANKGNFVNRSR